MRRLIALLPGLCLLNVAIPSLAAETSGEKIQPPAVKSASAAAKDGHIFISLEVANPNDVAIPYVGYTSDSFEGGLPAGTISPIYRVELQAGDAWKPHPIGFCGTGIGDVTLAPRSKVTFGVLLPVGDWTAAKVGLTWWDPATDGKETAITWSTPITPPDAK
jgi:hypothetical protein